MCIVSELTSFLGVWQLTHSSEFELAQQWHQQRERSRVVQSLANYGFAAKRCREAAVECGFQKAPALLMLSQERLEGVFDSEGLQEAEESLAAVDEDIIELRSDEATALEAIFPEDFTVIPPSSGTPYTTWRLRIQPPEGTLALVSEENKE